MLGPVRTTIIADEFANFPRAQVTIKALRLYRSRGVRLWTFVQDRNGYRQYKEEGSHQPFEENSISICWGIRDSQHLRDIQDRAGYNSVLVPGTNASAGITADTAGLSGGEQLTPVLPMSDAAKICDGKAILDIPGSGIGIIKRPFWWEIDWLKPYIRNAREHPPPHFDPE